jgi:heme/copper-type cytochrome/quinol oxidase subunit 3
MFFSGGLHKITVRLQLMNTIILVSSSFLCLDTKKRSKEKSRQTRSLRAFCLAHAHIRFQTTNNKLLAQ